MIARNPELTETFAVQLVKPSHYDDDGYVIQWVRASIPSNSLACVNALAEDVRERRALGPDVELRIDAYDEVHTVIPVRRIVKRVREASLGGVVLLIGVQSNQFPRAADLAARFREAGVQVVIGGFHVSGCLSMLPELPPELVAIQELGVSLFAGEAEGRLEKVLSDAVRGELEPVYRFLNDFPELEGQVTPMLPLEVNLKYVSRMTSFDAGRGCPFQCSFCTIINVQGQKSRWRSADDVEQIVRANVARGIRRFFLTDDNFARNKNWEAIVDRLIKLRREEGIRAKLILQVDTLCHRIPGFIEKCREAGCRTVFIGLENINPANLSAAGKRQNRITEYREMLQKWRSQGVITYAGYILGFPADTPESVAQDIQIIQRELPVDILEFFILTPLPGSEDHQRLHREGAWMDPDMNKYDLEHVTSHHAQMNHEEMQALYHRAWELYYTPEHIETMLRRSVVSETSLRRLALMICNFYGSVRFEKLHPLQSGILRRKDRKSRRPTFPRESPLIFYPRRVVEFFRTYVPMLLFVMKMRRLESRIDKDPKKWEYTDPALTPVAVGAEEELEMFERSDEARETVARDRARVARSMAKKASG